MTQQAKSHTITAASIGFALAMLLSIPDANAQDAVPVSTATASSALASNQDSGSWLEARRMFSVAHLREGVGGLLASVRSEIRELRAKLRQSFASGEPSPEAVAETRGQIQELRHEAREAMKEARAELGITNNGDGGARAEARAESRSQRAAERLEAGEERPGRRAARGLLRQAAGAAVEGAEAVANVRQQHRVRQGQGRAARLGPANGQVERNPEARQARVEQRRNTVQARVQAGNRGPARGQGPEGRRQGRQRRAAPVAQQAE